MRSYTILAALLVSPAWLLGNEFIGAEALLTRVQESVRAKQPQVIKSPAQLFDEKTEAFSNTAKKLSPEEAAAKWLDLLDEVSSLKKKSPQELADEDVEEDDDIYLLSITRVLLALPQSQSWEALAKAAEKRVDAEHPMRQQALRLWIAVLRNDGDTRRKAIKELQKLAASSPKLDPSDREVFSAELASHQDMLDLLVGTGEEKLGLIIKSMEAFEKASEKTSDMDYHPFSFPELLEIQDLDEAAEVALIKRALKLKRVAFPEGYTSRLAARVALENVASLKSPTWHLVESFAEVPLYEALAERFPNDEFMSPRRAADRIYLLHLLATDRLEEAHRLAQQISKVSGSGALMGLSNLQRMQRQGYGAQCYRFLSQYLKDQPHSPQWDDFIELALQEGKAQELEQRLREQVAKPTLDVGVLRKMQSHLVTVLLATNQVEAGIKQLRELIQRTNSELKQPVTESEQEVEGKIIEGVLVPVKKWELHPLEEQLLTGTLLVKLGGVLERKELVDEGASAVIQAYQKLPFAHKVSHNTLSDVIALLVNHDQAPLAESLLLTDLSEQALQKAATGYDSPQVPRALMMALTWVYSKTGRSQDIVFLLKHSPYWFVEDVSQLSGTFQQQPVSWMIAKALSQTGEREAARQIIRRTVVDYPRFDQGYALLLELGGDDLETELDNLASANPLEERPLIWKAQLQLKAGRFEEAEKTIREAIAIDPSDARQLLGDRMRAYTVLAHILEAKNPADKTQVNVARGVVLAMRLLERADYLWDAGLRSQALTKYEEGISLFAGDSSMQAHLSVRYREMGQAEKADVHYQRACELMLESIGRDNQLHPDCVAALIGTQVLSMAEKVFSEQADRSPESPHAFYLLGYVLEQQGDFTAAVEKYRHVIKLAPGYLNALQGLRKCAAEVRMSGVDKDAVSLALFKLTLDETYLKSIRNLALMWDAAIAVPPLSPQPPVKPMYPFIASALAMKSSRVIPSTFKNNGSRDRSEKNYRAYLWHVTGVYTVSYLIRGVIAKGW